MFGLWQAIVAGLAGTIVMTLMVAAGKAMGMTKMDMPLMLGGMFTDDVDRASAIGQVIHFMNGAIFGIVYGALLAASDGGVGIAVLIGLVHGVIAIVVMPMMGAMHPRVAAEGVPDGFPLIAPGLGGRNFGTGTPMGLVVGHLLYGLVFGLVYVPLV